MSVFSLHKGVRLLGKSDFVFSLNLCWAYCCSVVEVASNLEVPLLTNDGIVIPKIGLEKALKNSKNVPFMAGSNRDEVKLWLAAAEYFVELDYSLFGSILGIPKVKIKNEASFEAFNFYRSEAWIIRRAVEPISSLYIAGNLNT